MHVERKQRRNCLSLSAVLIQTETFHVMSVRFYNCTFKIDNSKFSLIVPIVAEVTLSEINHLCLKLIYPRYNVALINQNGHIRTCVTKSRVSREKVENKIYYIHI